MKLKLNAPAKINLGLSILRKLDNGYHEVKTIYTNINIFDVIELEEIKQNYIDFPDKTNLVYRAAELIRKELNINKGVKICLTKNIPIGSGLGGGSSDAAAVLKGLNILWQLDLDQKKLITLGKKLGSDVAYQLVGGTKQETQGGEKAGKFIDVGRLFKGWVVVCVPNIFISSKDAYLKIEYDKIGKSEALWHNDFEIWTFKQYPEIKKIKDIMIENGAEKSLMSGKGSAVWGEFNDKIKAQKLKEHLITMYPKTWMVKPFEKI